MEKVGLIYQKIPAIMADVDPIAKNRKNVAQNFNYRGIDDIYAALQAVLAKHGVFTVPEVIEERSEERQTRSGSNMIYRVLKIKYRFFASDGSFVEALMIGEGADSGDKAANKAMSIAQKYALLQVFCIPTEEPKDPDGESQELAPKKQGEKLSPPPPKPKEEKQTEVGLALRLNAMLEAFGRIGVSQDMLETKLGIPIGLFETAELNKSIAIYKDLVADKTKVAEVFNGKVEGKKA